MAKKKKTKPQAQSPSVPLLVRDRVVELRKVRASELAKNPKNFREHPEAQVEALRGVLSEVGFAGVALAYHSRRAGGALTLIDAHLRQDELGPDFEMACAITDLTDEEADKLLLSYDPISAMAEVGAEKLDALLRSVETGSEALATLYENMAEKAGLLDGDSKRSTPAGGEESPPPERWGVYIECRDEIQQKELLGRFAAEGLEVKSLII